MQASKPDRDHEDHAEEGELEAWVRFHKSSYTCIHAWQASKPPHEWSHEDGNDGEAWAGSLKLSFAVKHDHQDALGYEAWFNGPCRYRCLLCNLVQAWNPSDEWGGQARFC